MKKTLLIRYWLLLVFCFVGIFNKIEAQDKGPSSQPVTNVYIVATVQPVEKNDTIRPFYTSIKSIDNTSSVVSQVDEPSTNQLYIDLDEPKRRRQKTEPVIITKGNDVGIQYVLLEDNWTSIYLYGITGQMLLTVVTPTYQVAGSYNAELNIEFLPKGLYLCVINQGKERNTQKILKPY
jgi:hypothetical protein